PGPVQVGQESVDHHVADQVDLVSPVTLCPQVGARVWRGREQVIADPVGDDPVDLFWHRPVPAAQAGFDVADQSATLGSNQGTGHGRVHVAHDQDRVGTQLGDEA